MNHLEWITPEHQGPGPSSCYGLWEGTKVFNVYYGTMDSKAYTGPKYVIKCNLPGFRPDLPRQVSVEEAKAFAERMLTRWVAKRGLLFKKHIIVSEAMVEAAMPHAYVGENLLNPETIKRLIEAALAARG